MTLPRHTRTKEGSYRAARGDELAKNLAKDYPEFKSVNPRTKLETLRRKFGVNSINDVRRALRRARG
jgi:hypothetical protein